MKISPRKLFAQRFAELHEAAGSPALRRVAAAAEARMRAARDHRAKAISTASAQRISDWKSGRNVPARFESLLPVLLTLIEAAKRADHDVPAELLDVPGWRKLWAESDSWTPEAEEVDAVCPYRGLTPYRRGDAELFFGRARPTAEFTELVRDTAAAGGGLVVLVGASGAGKSSLLEAGLVPAIADDWTVASMTPTADPIAAFKAATATQSQLQLLIVDQFEELFTACDADCAPEDLLGELERLAAQQVVVVIALRADFYARCLDYPMLTDALERRSYLLGPMRLDELAEAVTGPAESAGLKLEPGLEELVITELCGVGASGATASVRQGYDPGALPLLSHVMAAAWERREGARLTIAGYRKAGGVVGSVAATAEAAWSKLSEAEKAAAKRLLLALVVVGHDSRDTRRRVALDDVEWVAPDSGSAIQTLSRARLLTVDGESTYLTHEIVVDAWPRLRAWIDEDRVGSLVRQRLDSDASDWAAAGRDRWMLYRGARLTSAREHCHAATIGPIAAEFLEASQEARRRTQRRKSATQAILALLGVVVTVLALAAYSQSRTATAQRNDAVFARILSQSDRLQETDPTASADLDMQANRMRHGDQEVLSRLLATQGMPLATVIPAIGGSVKQLSYSPNGRILATAGHDNTVRLWEVSDPRNPRPLGHPLTGHTEFMTSAVFRPDGQVLASSGGDHTVRLWDVSHPENATLIGAPLRAGGGAVYPVAFSPDGRILAAPNDDHTVELWDVANPAAPHLLGAPLVGHTGPVRCAAFSPDGRLLATAGDDHYVQLWNMADPSAPVPVGPALDGFTATAHAVAFSPTGGRLAAGSDDGTVQLWDVSDPAVPRLLGPPLDAHTAQVWSVTFSPDGRNLATASTDGTAKLWSLADPAHPHLLGEPLRGNGSALTVAFSPDGRTLAVGGHDGAVRLWSLPPAVLDGHSGRVAAPAFDGTGRLMATASDYGSIQLWDTTNPHSPQRLARLDHGTPINYVTISPNGRTVATVDQSASTVRLFDINDTSVLRPQGVLNLPARYTYALAFSPDSSVLLTQSDDHSIRLWSVADPVNPGPLGDPMLVSDGGFVSDAKFSPDGKLLATAAGGIGELWDVSSPSHPRRVGPALAVATNGVRRVAFDPTGHTLYTAGDDALRVWDVSNPQSATQVGTPYVGHDSAIDSIAVSRDGQWVATGGDDASVRLWHLTDHRYPVLLRHSVALPDTASWNVSFMPAGAGTDFMAGGGTGGVLRLWDLDPDHARARVCAVLERC